MVLKPNALLMILEAFFYFGVPKSSISNGFIKVFDMEERHALSSEKPNAFSMFLLIAFSSKVASAISGRLHFEAFILKASF